MKRCYLYTDNGSPIILESGLRFMLHPSHALVRREKGEQCNSSERRGRRGRVSCMVEGGEA